MVLALSIMAIFLSVFIFSFMVLLMPATERRQVKKQLQHISSYNMTSTSGANFSSELGMTSLPLAQRVIKPLLVWILNLVKKITPIGMVAFYKRHLVLAGNPKDLNVDRFLSIKALCLLVLLGLLALLAIFGLAPKSRVIFSGLFLLPLVFFLPDLWLLQKAEKRQKAIRLALPDTLDLLTISVEAGLGFDAALTKVIKNSRGPLAEECSKMLSESQVGISRREALKNLAVRTSSHEMQTFVAAMIQADVFGVSIRKVLRAQASQIRLKRRQKAEEVAMKVPVKIVFPVVLCILPCLLVVILGPAAIRIYFTLLPILHGK